MSILSILLWVHSSGDGGVLFFLLLALALILIVIGLIVMAVFRIIFWIKEFIYKTKIRGKLPELSNLIEQINSLFLPTRKANQSDIDTFIKENETAIGTVEESLVMTLKLQEVRKSS